MKIWIIGVVIFDVVAFAIILGMVFLG